MKCGDERCLNCHPQAETLGDPGRFRDAARANDFIGQLRRALVDQIARRVAAEKRAEEAEQARDETVAAWASAADDRDTYSSKLAAAEDRARELEFKGLQLINYLGPLMLAAQAVVSGRMGAMDELRRMLDVKYDPTNGEALSLAAQLAEALKRADGAERLYADIANPKCLDDACGHLWREHEASGADCEEPCLVAGCPCAAFEGESDAARFAVLTTQLAAANAEIGRLKGAVRSATLAHLDAMIDTGEVCP